MRIDGRRRLSSLLPPFRLRTYRKSGFEGIDTEKVISIIEPFWYECIVRTLSFFVRKPRRY